MLSNPTYKQLEARMRIGAFTLSQWTEIAAATIGALVFGVYLSPFSTTLTLFTAVVVAGSPLALSYGAMAHEWSVVDALRAQWRWFTKPRRHLPGPGIPTSGYLVVRQPPETPARGHAVQGREPSVLWDL